jgi:hypothetical protein
MVIADEFPTAFGEDITEPSLLKKFKVKLKNGACYVCMVPRRLSDPMLAEVQKQIAALLAQGVIRQSNSPFAFPIVLARRPGSDKIRVCCDFRLLNDMTEPYPYSIPNLPVPIPISELAPHRLRSPVRTDRVHPPQIGQRLDEVTAVADAAAACSHEICDQTRGNCSTRPATAAPEPLMVACPGHPDEKVCRFDAEPEIPHHCGKGCALDAHRQLGDCTRGPAVSGKLPRPVVAAWSPRNYLDQTLSSCHSAMPPLRPHPPPFCRLHCLSMPPPPSISAS